MVVDRTLKKALGWLYLGMLSAFLAATAGAQTARGKAEMKAGTGVVTIDYGRPSLKGRDMFSRLEEGSFWRMGMNEATVLTTPVDLVFGTTQVAKGSYSLWLRKEGDKFLLVFNSQTGQWGTKHDTGKDVYRVAMKSEPVSSPVETFTIDLTGATKGGELGLTWGAMKLSSGFAFGQ